MSSAYSDWLVFAQPHQKCPFFCHKLQQHADLTLALKLTVSGVKIKQIKSICKLALQSDLHVSKRGKRLCERCMHEWINKKNKTKKT